MRVLLAVSLLAVILPAHLSAASEKRTFIVATNSDGYGIDRCLASGEKCGAAAANAYCRTQAFTAAARYHKIDQDELTKSVTKDASVTCQPGACEIVAIICLR